MAQTDMTPEVLTAASQDAQAAFQEWNSGNQDSALNRVMTHADQGEPWAVGFYVWLRMQQGLPGLRPALPYAKRARALGMPWVSLNLFNSMIGNLAGDPQLLEPALELFDEMQPVVAWGIDPIGQGWNLLSQNRAVEAIRIMSVTAPPLPTSPDTWNSLVTGAQAQSQELQTLLGRARSAAGQVETAATEGGTAIAKIQDDLQTKALQAELLISSVNSGAVNALFDEEATRNENESKTAWGWGITVLVAAAFVAVLPLVLHYFKAGPDLADGALLGAHAGSTLALATVAGVLLARARGRDRARQKARDLSTAMGTMISYSNQIQDEGEKQQFMLTMGQLVLQAHLRADGGASSDDSLAGWAALLNAMRTPSVGA